jgi:hypothetical protein
MLAINGEGHGFDRGTLRRQLGFFHEPDGAMGRIATMLMHSLTMAQVLGSRNEISSTDNANKLAIFYDRHNPLDRVPFEQSSNLMERRFWRGGNDIGRHDVCNLAGVRLDVFSGERLVSGPPQQPPGPLSFCACLGTMQQIALTDDPDELALIVHDGNSADPSLQQRRRDLLH